MKQPMPLDGTTVLDLTRALSGPFCTTLLGDLGADVIKVESESGDMIRNWGPYLDGVSTYHLAVNRNKRSIALDLRSSAGKDILFELVKKSDVLVENFRPGILAKLGLSRSRLEEINPRLIHSSVTGFGGWGPKTNDPGFDQIAQGMGGLMSVTGDPAFGPTRVGIPISDILSGMFSAIGVAASLFGREKHGHAARVETSLLESVVGVLTFQAQRYLSLGEVPGQTGNDHPVISPYGVYEASDGPFNLAIGTESQWTVLCDILDSDELRDDTRFHNGEARRLNREILRDELNSRFAKTSVEIWMTKFRAFGLPAGPINDMAAVFADEQVRELQLATEMTHPRLGKTHTLRGPINIDGSPSPVSRTAPELGQHTSEILSDFLGMSEENIRHLSDDKVIVRYLFQEQRG